MTGNELQGILERLHWTPPVVTCEKAIAAELIVAILLTILLSRLRRMH